jgi:hypothetical protein
MFGSFRIAVFSALSAVVITASAAAAQESSGSFVATALNVPETSIIQMDGAVSPISANTAQLFRVGDEQPAASPALIIEQGAYANLKWDARPDMLFGTGGTFDCARDTVACPTTELRLERFDEGASLFMWDLTGAVERPTGSQIVRFAVLAYDPRYPSLNDTRANTPFTRVNKIWVMDYTATSEIMRFFQVDNNQFREFRTDAISGFNGDRGFTAIAPQAFAGVTNWNFHTYLLDTPDEGGHSLMSPDQGMTEVAGPTISVVPTTPEPCAPRPAVALSTKRLGDGVLEVTVRAGSGGLVRLEIGEGQNWTVDPATPTEVPEGATELTFRVRRTSPGVVNVPLNVVDACGSWRTFVGGGANAF